MDATATAGPQPTTPTVDVVLTPSVRLLKYASSLHVLPLALLPFAMQPGAAMAAVVAGIAASWLSLRRSAALGFGPKALRRITLHAESASVHDGAGREHAASLLGESLNTRHLVVLRFRLNSGGTLTRAIGGDELPDEALRRLKVRLAMFTP